MTWKTIYIVLILFFGQLIVNAQSIANATAQYNEFVQAISSSGESINAYNSLYLCFEQYWGVLNGNDATEINQARGGLKKIFPYINNGAYYYTKLNDRDKAEQFVEAYIDISLHEAMQGEFLSVGADYATFAWMAACKNYNSKNYTKAITYLQAYINSGEAEKRADAYNFMAKSYIHLNDMPHAQYILEQGLLLYPDDIRMLATIINILGEYKTNDIALQKYVSQAIRYKPDDEGLLNIQVQLYERTNNFEQAAMICNRLRQTKPQSLDVARHLAINYYNAGVVYAQKANNSDGKESGQYKQEASSYFSLAVQVLNDVLYSDPLAINYAYALANAYAYIGDKANLQTINGKIQALGYSPSSIGGDMQLMAYNSTPPRPNLTAPKPVPSNSFNQPLQPGNHPPITSTSNAPQKQIVSDVDIDIPVNKTNNTNTFAVIIANEKYKKVAEVPNAENDGIIFAEYCNKVLGIPNDNIRKHLNVTFGGMLDAIEDMKAIASAKHGNCNFILYYAGHGVPDEKTKTAYILPVDADGKQMRVCYSLASLYTELQAMEANCTTVFLDACFSGATRSESDMLMSARSVAIAVDDNEVEGNIVIFSAATNDQSALAYDEQKHGMFTYYLLKKLKESRGDINLQELSDYIKDNVTLQARLKNHKDQTPTVIPGVSMGEKWKHIKLK